MTIPFPRTAMKKLLGFLVLSLLSVIAAAQTAVVTRNVNLRPDASPDNGPIETLKPGSQLTLLDPGFDRRVLPCEGARWAGWVCMGKECKDSCQRSNPERDRRRDWRVGSPSGCPKDIRSIGGLYSNLIPLPSQSALLAQYERACSVGKCSPPGHLSASSLPWPAAILRASISGADVLAIPQMIRWARHLARSIVAPSAM